MFSALISLLAAWNVFIFFHEIGKFRFLCQINMFDFTF